MEDTFDDLERGVHAALETYSNVHRGSGHNSIVSTHLFEQARDIVLEHLGLEIDEHKNTASRPPDVSGWDIGQGSASARVLVIPTDEELVFTEDVAAILNGIYTDHMHFQYSFARQDFVRK